MVESSHAFTEPLRAAAEEDSVCLDYIEESLRYCLSVSEGTQVMPADGSWRLWVQLRSHAYAFATVGRVEQLLIGLIAESNAGRRDTTILIARSLLESAAAVYYAFRMIEAHKRNGKGEAMDQNLDRLLLGANRFSNPEGKCNPPWSVDTLLGKVDEDHKGAELRDHYTWLSDFVHPNGPALCLFHQELAHDGRTVQFRKAIPFDRVFISQVYPAVAFILTLARKGWEWLFAFQWK